MVDESFAGNQWGKRRRLLPRECSVCELNRTWASTPVEVTDLA